MLERRLLDRSGLDALIAALRREGYIVVGPRVSDGAIVYDEVRAVGDLPEGWSDEQQAGTYRLKRREDSAVFGYAVGPDSWKRFLFPPRTTLWSAERSAIGGFTLAAPDDDPRRYAFLGVRGCELAAIAVQDRIFIGDGRTDPVYSRRREAAFVVAVNCAEPAGTCFCVSMGTGPRAGLGYDILLTELLDGERHVFLAEAATERGEKMLAPLPSQPATESDVRAADAVVERAAGRMGRTMDAVAARSVLAGSRESAHWDDTAARCLACANCTMVCPTCFCSTIEDTTDLAGDHAERTRRWDSCFTLAFSELGGGYVRASTAGRYRHWITHKLSTWVDQFGVSGCVGCGRCITWCPVGIDITEEVGAVAAEKAALHALQSMNGGHREDA